MSVNMDKKICLNFSSKNRYKRFSTTALVVCFAVPCPTNVSYIKDHVQKRPKDSRLVY